MKTKYFGTQMAALLIVAVSAATAARAQQTVEVAPPAPAAHLALSAAPAANAVPEGTPVFVALKQTLRSGRARAGEVVAFEVVSDVRAADGQSVLISKGIPAWGTVAESRGAGAFGKPGRLRVTCDYVLLADNTRVALRPGAAGLGARGRGRGGAAVVSGTVVGLGVGLVVALAEINPLSESTTGSPAGTMAALASGVLVASLWRGGNVTLPEGKTFAVEVAATSATGTPPAPAASP